MTPKKTQKRIHAATDRQTRSRSQDSDSVAETQREATMETTQEDTTFTVTQEVTEESQSTVVAFEQDEMKLIEFLKYSE